jgi:hypothetical protein
MQQCFRFYTTHDFPWLSPGLPHILGGDRELKIARVNGCAHPLAKEARAPEPAKVKPLFLLGRNGCMPAQQFSRRSSQIIRLKGTSP